MACMRSSLQTEALLEKLEALPADKVAEVEDFVDFLSRREDDRQLTRAARDLSEPSIRAVWDNPDDAEYDRL